MDEQAKNEVPVYPYGAVIAHFNGEAEQFHADRKAYRECVKAIDEAIRTEWNGSNLPDNIAREVLERFGAERVSYVLADVIQTRMPDQRFSPSNRDWARTVPAFLPKEFRINSYMEAHSEKLNEFISKARRDMGRVPGLEEKAKQRKAIPVYPHSLEYANNNKEESQYWQSHYANVVCKEALDSAISRYYRNNSLDTKAASQEVTGQFGFDRTLHVLANSVRHIAWDERISRDNVKWAESVTATDQPDQAGNDKSQDYRVGTRGNPGLMNMLVSEVRKEYALAQEQERTANDQQSGNSSAKPSKEAESAKSAEKNKAFRNVPFYPYSRDYAQDQGETEQYRASRKANEACRAAIDRAIAQNFKDNHLPVTAAQSVLREFGKERVSFILAHTMRIKNDDGRFSGDNREWAHQVPGYEIYNPFGLVCQSHPAILDLFIDQAREEILIHTPLKREDIKAEAQSILTAFQQLQEPNTEDKAHFAVNVSDMFVKRAKPKDMERLSNMLPFASLSIATVPGRHGTSAVISQDENRFQKLVLRRPSIRAQLAAKPPERETPVPKPRTKEAALE